MKRTPNKGSTRAKKQEQNDEYARMFLALGTIDRETFQAITGKGLSVYWRPSAWITGSDGRQPAYWNPFFAACVRLGIKCVMYRNEENQSVIDFTEMPEVWAQAQREEMIENNKNYRAKLRARKAAAKEVSTK